jgi:hypothetical protein
MEQRVDQEAWFFNDGDGSKTRILFLPCSQCFTR